MASASSILPWAASQRGLSGMPARNPHTATAPAPPSTTTQRHPSTPAGFSGTSHHASRATTGTMQKEMN